MATQSFEQLIAGANKIKTNELPESNTASLVGEQLIQMVNKQSEEHSERTAAISKEQTDRSAAIKAEQDARIKGTTEYNVSVQHPTGGIGGTNKYTLETAIQKIPAELRTVGIKCSFIGEDGSVFTYTYEGPKFTDILSWTNECKNDIYDLKRVDKILENISPFKVEQEITDFPSKGYISKGSHQLVTTSTDGLYKLLAIDSNKIYRVKTEINTMYDLSSVVYYKDDSMSDSSIVSYDKDMIYETNRGVLNIPSGVTHMAVFTRNQGRSKIEIGNFESVASKHSVKGDIININTRFGDSRSKYTLQEAINLIPDDELSICKGIIYADNSTGRLKLSFLIKEGLSDLRLPINWVTIDVYNINSISNMSELIKPNAGNIPVHSLQETISLIPESSRIPGKIVLYAHQDGHFHIAFFNSSSTLSGWNNMDNWVDVKIKDLSSLVSRDELNGKVDKVVGKMLSSNDFTDEYKKKLESLSTDISVPETVVKTAVDDYVTKNSAGFVTKKNGINVIDEDVFNVSDNLLSAPTSIGEGWTGNMESGFTHTTGQENPLSFDISKAPLKSKLLIRFTCTNLKENTDILVSIGNSGSIKSYNGTDNITAGLIYDGGLLTLTPMSNFNGTISNIRCNIIGEGSERINIKVDNILCERNNLVYGFWNTFIGPKFSTARSFQDGTRCIAMGYNALRDMKIGNRNVAIGTFAMPCLTKGENNVAIGSDTIYPLVEAHNCIGIGKATLGGSQSAKDCVAIGHGAMGAYTLAKDRTRCVVVGADSAPDITDNCTHIGYRAGYNVVGANNTSIGCNSMCVGTRTSREITGSELTCVGCNAEIANTPEAKSAVNSTALGANTAITKSNQLVLGNAQVEEVLIAGKIISFNPDGTVTWRNNG